MSVDDSAMTSPTTRLRWRVITLTIAIEVFTVAIRYGFDLQAARDGASSIGGLTGGLRLHHGYLGLLFLALALVLRTRAPRLAQHLQVWGLALFLSDAVDHLLVRWPIEGSHGFQFWYSVPSND